MEEHALLVFSSQCNFPFLHLYHRVNILDPTVGVSMVDGAGLAAAAGGEPSVFIVKYSYNPSEMSPNPNHEAELTLVAGDYIYVFGEMDGDGFYHAQLTTGEEGLVPSNFIELVEQEEGKFTGIQNEMHFYSTIIPS